VTSYNGESAQQSLKLFRDFLENLTRSQLRTVMLAGQRWNLDRLAQANGDEDRSLSESGIGAWSIDLKHEDHG
jgi:hypothetical protein